MVRAILLISILSLFLAGCTQRMVCPAYQSAFIYDKNELRKKFSYFKDDTIPKVYTASKNKYLIAEAVPYRKKVRTMQTVAVKPVYVAVPDSLKPESEQMIDGEDGVVAGAELDLAARSVIDSTFIVDVPKKDSVQTKQDTVYVISKDREVRVLKYNFPDSLVYDPASGRYVPEKPKYVVAQVGYNVQQDNYLWYMRKYLVLPDVRVANAEKEVKKEEERKKDKQGFAGFFKNLFKKKNKEEVDSSQLAATPKDEFDFIDEPEDIQDSTTQFLAPARKPTVTPSSSNGDEEEEPDQTKPSKKKKDKKKKSKQPEQKPNQPVLKTDDEDGF